MPVSPLGGSLDTAPAFATPTFDIVPRPLSGVSAPNLTPGPAFVAGDRVKDTALSVTSSLVTLSKANPYGFENFKDGVGDGNYCFYCLSDSVGNYEVQYGLYSDSVGTLTRAAVPLSSNTTPGGQVALSGTVTVFGNWPAAAEMATAFGVSSGFTGPYNRTASSATLRSNTVFYTPIFIPQAFSAFQLLFSGGAAGVYVDVGLYSHRGGYPFLLLGQQTAIAAISGGQQLTSVISSNGPKAPGMYWTAMLVRNGGAGEGTVTFSAVPINGIVSANDVIGATATNVKYVGFYEGIPMNALPVQASQPPNAAQNGNFPNIPALWMRPIL